MYSSLLVISIHCNCHEAFVYSPIDKALVKCLMPSNINSILAVDKIAKMYKSKR